VAVWSDSGLFPNPYSPCYCFYAALTKHGNCSKIGNNENLKQYPFPRIHYYHSQKRGKYMYGKPLFVRAEWDEVARVWVATSDDVPGLATEGDNLEGLIEKLKIMIPELLDVNEAKGEGEVSFELLTRRFEIAQRTSC
jgi:hypothetical protein